MHTTDHFAAVKLLHESTRLPISLLNDELQPVVRYPAPFPLNPAYQRSSELFQVLSLTPHLSYRPIVHITNAREQFISMTVPHHTKTSTWLIGPFLTKKLEKSLVTGLLHDLHYPTSKERFETHYASLTVVPQRAAHYAGALAWHMTTGMLIGIEELIHLKTEHPTIQPDSDLIVSANRQQEERHMPYQMEQSIFKSIREGRKEAIEDSLIFPENDGKVGILSKKSYLRNEKNLAIAFITLATRHAMDGGLEQELAYTMSDLYIQTIEDMQEVEAIQQTLLKAVYEFTDRVSKAKLHRYSRPVNQCLTHIFNHLYEEITLSQLATLVNMNPNYLSTLFKKETGITITHYIQQQKIAEAKTMLLQSDRSISEIFSLLNFHDQAHFTNIFKKQTGTTPALYRKKGGKTDS